MPKRNIKQNQKPSEKNNSQILLGIANLILTAIIGIAVALYINYRNQQYQKELIQLQANSAKELAQTQAELERASKIANLELSLPCQYYTECSSPIRVRNLGPATAINVKIVISISRTEDIWQSTINHISNFKLETFPPSREFTIKKKHADLMYSSSNIDGDNSYEVVTSNLPAQSQFDLKLSLDETLPVEIKEVNRKATVTCDESEACLGTSPLWEYLFFIHPVSRFYIFAECDNCEGSWFLDDNYFVSSITDQHAMRMYGLTLRPKEFSFDFIEAYAIPEDLDFTPATSPIVLSIKRNDEGRFVISEK